MASPEDQFRNCVMCGKRFNYVTRTLASFATTETYICSDECYKASCKAAYMGTEVPGARYTCYTCWRRFPEISERKGKVNGRTRSFCSQECLNAMMPIQQIPLSAFVDARKAADFSQYKESLLDAATRIPGVDAYEVGDMAVWTLRELEQAATSGTLEEKKAILRELGLLPNIPTPAKPTTPEPELDRFALLDFGGD